MGVPDGNGDGGAETLYVRSLEISKRRLGLEHPDVATGLNNLAGLYRMQGRYADAESLYLWSLEIDEKALGPDHPDVATDQGAGRSSSA